MEYHKGFDRCSTAAAARTELSSVFGRWLCSKEKEKHWVDNWSMDKYDKGANNADNYDSNDDDVKHDAEELEV